MDILSYTLGKKAGGGSSPVLQDKEITITENGETTVSADSGYDGLNSVNVATNVPQPSGSINITTNGTHNVSDYAEANVNVPAGITPTGTINITSNGTTDVTNYASANVNVPSQKYAPRKISFVNYTGTELNYELANLDVSNITNMQNMFSSCAYIPSLNLEQYNWDTSNVTNMNSMFSSIGMSAFGGYSGVTLALNNLDVSNVTNMGSMFNQFYGTSLDLSNWESGRAVDCSGMFNFCKYLTTLKLNKFNPTLNRITAGSMFSNCSALQHLDIRSMVLSHLTTVPSNFVAGVPTTCEIIVKDVTEKSWWNSKYSSYTNVKTVAEYEAEQA